MIVEVVLLMLTVLVLLAVCAVQQSRLRRLARSPSPAHPAARPRGMVAGLPTGDQLAVEPRFVGRLVVDGRALHLWAVTVPADAVSVWAGFVPEGCVFAIQRDR